MPDNLAHLEAIREEMLQLRVMVRCVTLDLGARCFDANNRAAENGWAVPMVPVSEIERILAYLPPTDQDPDS